jgi:hypothetical protein
MSIQRVTKLISVVACVFISLLAVGFANAGNIKKNNQELMIEVDASGCASSVNLISPVDNCEGSEFAGSCGKNGKDCVCMRDQKFVSWMISADTRFELKFNGASPFKNNCKFKSGNNKKIQCKIEAGDGNYDYDVIVESCPNQVYDPRIIVKA